MKKRRLSAELNWIKRLQTPFPLGLNDQIYQQGNISSVRSNINVFSLKPDVRRKRRSHGLRRNGLSRRKQRLNRSLDDLLRIANNNGRHELLHALSSIPVSRLKPILDDADRRSLRHSDWFKLKMIMAFSFNKLFPRIPQLPPKTQYIKIKFINQGLDLLNISNIFRDHRVASKIPQYFENLDPPLICYQYKKPIRNIIFNYNQVTSDPDVRSSIQSSCSCADSPFLYPPAGHVVTGDLACIPDKGLRSLFKKGPKYRLPSRIDFTKCRSIVEEALQTYCKRWCKKEGVGVHALNDRKDEFLRIVDIRIENFTTHPHLYKQPPSRSVKALKKKMEKLHSKYVFAPADKAANNVIIIWKRYYVEVLKEELNSTSTYVPAQLTKDKLLLRHIDSLTKSNIKIDKLDLPTFYWLPKLHKNPYKSRFISNSSHCSTTILSKHITSALTTVKDHVIKYSETAFSNSNVNYFWSIKNSSEVIEKLRLRNFQGSQVSSFDFSTLYTSLPHDLIKAKVLSLVKWCFDRESKTYLCTSAKAGFFSNKKYDSYACWTCTELCEAFTFLMENIYVQFDGMVYQQIVGIPMGTNCAPLIAELFLYCYERDFMSNLQKSKRFDLIDKFNDTSRYLDDIFTIDNPTFAEHIPDIYPRELQSNEANTSDKETSFLDLNIKVIGNDIHTSVYDKCDDFGFPIYNFPWLSGDVPRLPSYGIYISQLVRFARCCTSVFDFHSKNLQITSKLLTQGYRYHKLRKTFGKFFRSYSELLSKFGAISFQEYVSKGITHPVFYGDLVYKLRRVKNESNFISSGSKIVKRLRRRQYDPEIIERTIGLVLGPFTALYRSFLKRCTLTNKAVGTIWRALSKPPQRRQGPDPRPLWLLVGTPSAFGPELAYRLRVVQPTLMDVPLFLIYFYITIYVCVPHFYDLSALVGCWSSVSIRRIIYKFLNVCPFDYTAVAVSGKVERS